MSIDKKKILLVIVALALAYVLIIPSGPTKEDYKVEAFVSDNESGIKAGISADKGELDFGAVYPRVSSVEKELEFENNGESDMVVVLRVEGNISSSIVLKPKRLTLSPGESSNAKVVFERKGLSPGYYAGSVIVEKRKGSGLWG